MWPATMQESANESFFQHCVVCNGDRAPQFYNVSESGLYAKFL